MNNLNFYLGENGTAYQNMKYNSDNFFITSPNGNKLHELVKGLLNLNNFTYSSTICSNDWETIEDTQTAK